MHTQFSRNYFENELPKLQRITDRNGQVPCVILTVQGGERIELRDFEVSGSGLVLTRSSGKFVIPFHMVSAIQFAPDRKSLAAGAHSTPHHVLNPGTKRT